LTHGKSQWVVYSALLGTNAFLAFLTFALGLHTEFMVGQDVSAAELPDVPAWVLGLGNAAIILIVYGLLGLAGLWFARKLGWPGVFRQDAGWRNRLWMPMGIGVAVGVVLVVADRLFALAGDWSGFAHPTFPMSLIASATAGIGEEIVFRVFVMGLWAFLSSWALSRGRATNLSLWIGNTVAALAFAAAHLPTAMLLVGAQTPAELPAVVLVELFALNSLVALIAGACYVRDGLVAAVGVHFWADIMWHVLWPLVAH
jgi:hypothetical protein